MGSAFHIVKLIFAIGLGVAATVCIWALPAMVLPLGVTSLAWSMMPE